MLRDADGTRLCRVADLDVRWAGVNGATGGEMLGYVAVADRLAEPCALRGIPEVRIMLDDGTPLPADVHECSPGPTSAHLPAMFTCDPSRSVILRPVSATPTPGRGMNRGEASFLLIWHIHDGAGFCPRPPTGVPTTLELTLPDSAERISIPLGSDDEAQDYRRLIARATCADGFTVFGFAPFEP